MLVRETELEEHFPSDSALLLQVPALLLQHTHICWSNWLADKWGKTSELPFPDLVRIWMAMENQEPWEPTFPEDYTLTPKFAYRGGISTRPTPGPTDPTLWTTLEALAAPAVAAAAMVALTLNADPARRSSGR